MEPYEEHFVTIADVLTSEHLTSEHLNRVQPLSASGAEPGTDLIPVTIEQLSRILSCTPRNVKIILRRLEELGYIRWEAGRGRGHTSKISLMRSREEVLAGAFRRELDSGHIKEAIELLGRPEIGDKQKGELWEALHAEMGLSSQTTAAGGTDVMQMIRYRALGSLDPASVFTAFEAYMIGQVCNTLVRYEADSQSFEPGLAYLWEHSEDFTRWTFYLRKGVRFHNGKALTARDVQYTVDRLNTLNSPVLWSFLELEKLEIHGDYAFTFVFSGPNRFMLHIAGSYPMSILPEGWDSQKRLIGTGPFRIASQTKESLRLTAFDEYFGYRPLLDEVTLWFFPEMASSERHYQVSSSGNPAELLSRPVPTGICPEYRAAGCKYVLFNFRTEGPHHQAAFREVLHSVYNPELLLEELGGNRLSPAASFLPWKSQKTDFNSLSPEEAKRLLDECGYEGQEIRLAFKGMKEEVEEAEWFRRRCEALGIPITFVPYKDVAFESLVDRADLIMAEESIEEDWEWGMINYFRSSGNAIHLFLGQEQTAAIDEILDRYMEQGEQERWQLLDRVEELLRKQHLLLYGCHMNKKAFYDQDLQGLQTTSFGFLDFSKLWIKAPGGAK